MTIEVEDHEEEAVALLLEQFKGKAAIEAWLRGLVAPLNGVESIAVDLLTKRYTIDDAEGVQLDGIGALVGMPREDGLSDADYRIQIRQQIAVNASNGRGDDIINASFVGFGVSGAFIHLVEAEEANGEFEAYERTPDTGAILEGIFSNDFAARIFRLVNLSRSASFYFVMYWGDLDTTSSKPGFKYDTAGGGYDGLAAYRIAARAAE